MASPYMVSRPVYGGPPSQGPLSSYSSMGPPPYLSRSYASGVGLGGPPFYGGPPLSNSYRASPPSASPASFPVYDDLPNLRGSPGLIILCLYILLISSLFACLGRADFNFVLYLLGYHLWCIESDYKTAAGLRRLVRGARQFAVLLSITTLVDITWQFIAFSTWACEKEEPQLCFPEPQNLRVKWTHGIHSFALYLSLINLVLKVLLIFLTFSWVQQQRGILGIPPSRGTAISPPVGAPASLCD